jgi:hypothetical protein
MATRDSERSSRARLAALERWSRLDPAQRSQATGNARRAFLARFPNESGLRAHMTRLGRASAKRRKAPGGDDPELPIQ